MKIGTEVINMETGNKGRVIAYQGDGSIFAVQYGPEVGIVWTCAKKLKEAVDQPELPLKTAPASTGAELDPGS